MVQIFWPMSNLFDTIKVHQSFTGFLEIKVKALLKHNGPFKSKKMTMMIQTYSNIIKKVVLLASFVSRFMVNKLKSKLCINKTSFYFNETLIIWRCKNVSPKYICYILLNASEYRLLINLRNYHLCMNYSREPVRKTSLPLYIHLRNPRENKHIATFK
jgi:hypothetical protein